MLRYDIQVKDGSMYNTPPTYAIYLAGLVFEELEKTGGVARKRTQRGQGPADLRRLDASSFYRPVADREDRSIMNITFTTPDPDTDARFVKEAAARAL